MPANGTQGLTVEELARAKALPAEFLRDACGLHDGRGAVLIPYWDAAGEPLAEKRRTAAVAKEGSRWPAGVPLQAYGQWRLDEARKAGFLILVEGESDCWALWHHGVPALGLPGSGTAKVLTAELLAGLARVYVLREPDPGGWTFARGVGARLREVGFHGQALLLEMPTGVKDPADLHALAPAGFLKSLEVCILQARDLGPVAAEPGRAPDRNGAAPEEPPWGPPVPLTDLPAPAPFPAGVLPQALEEYAAAAAYATNSPVDFVAVPLLGLAAGCLGAARALGVTRDHVQPATVFVCVVGLPGTGKSPALERVAEPLEEAERRYLDQWRRRLDAWHEDDSEARGAKPQPRRLLVDDTTTEALMRTLAANPRGGVMVRDELSALVAGMNQYKEGKGHDRQVYMKIWACATIRVDRKGNEDGLPLVVPRPSLSVVGGVQPDVVESFLGEERGGLRVNDGFLDRFLFSYPADLPAVEEQWREVPEEVAAAWDGAVQWLLSVEPWNDPVRGRRPKVVRLDGDGRQAWADFTRSHAAELNGPDFPDHLRGPWSKLRGCCARLALTLHYLRLACEAPGGTGPDDVGGRAVASAAALVGYFKAHYQRVAGRMSADPRVEEAGRVLSWLRRRPEVQRFSRRDAHAALRRSFQSPEELDRPLGLLAQHGHLRPLKAAERTGPGRKATQEFEVNPLWSRVDFVDFVDSVTAPEI